MDSEHYLECGDLLVCVRRGDGASGVVGVPRVMTGQGVNGSPIPGSNCRVEGNFGGRRWTPDSISR